MKELKDSCAAGGEEPAESGHCKTRLRTERAADPDERRLRRELWLVWSIIATLCVVVVALLVAIRLILAATFELLLGR